MAIAERPSSISDPTRDSSLLGEGAQTLCATGSGTLLEETLSLPSRLTSVPVAGDDWEEDEDYPFFDDDEEEDEDEDDEDEDDDEDEEDEEEDDEEEFEDED